MEKLDDFLKLVNGRNINEFDLYDEEFVPEDFKLKRMHFENAQIDEHRWYELIEAVYEIHKNDEYLGLIIGWIPNKLYNECVCLDDMTFKYKFDIAESFEKTIITYKKK